MKNGPLPGPFSLSATRGQLLQIIHPPDQPYSTTLSLPCSEFPKYTFAHKIGTIARLPRDLIGLDKLRGEVR
jgi:hypothetical protein